MLLSGFWASVIEIRGISTPQEGEQGACPVGVSTFQAFLATKETEALTLEPRYSSWRT